MRIHMLVTAAAVAAVLLLSACSGEGSPASSAGSDNSGTQSAVPGTGSSVSQEPAAPPADGSASSASSDAELESAADALLTAMASGDFGAVSTWIAPEGVTFTPYSNVDFDADRTVSAAELAAFGTDSASYIWGRYDGSGNEIEMTPQEYWTRFVWNTDYSTAPDISVNTIMQSGNSLENVQDAYPEAQFVEYHFDGLDPQYGGVDWCSLKLVFLRYNGAWKLRGVIHSEMTV